MTKAFAHFRVGRHTTGLVVKIALALALVSCSSGASKTTSATDSTRPERDDVRLPDKRLLSVRCAGRGLPTVILESGFGADAGAWYRVQPALAQTTRVCSYDRAGYGFSDPGPLPRDGAAIARDLDHALIAAGIRGPFIVVGHSAGGLYARLFAARRPQDVRGLVLVDPTVERRAPQPVGDGLDGIRQRLHRCLGAAETSAQAAFDDPVWAGCVGANPDDNAAAVARRPATWRNQISELDAIFGRTSDQILRLGAVLRDIPLYVITASETATSSPLAPFGPPVSVWELQHQQLAAMSQVGYQTTVVGPHLLMIARPEVVLGAVREMVAATRSRRRPGPLPLSEMVALPPARPDTLVSGSTSLDRPLTANDVKPQK